MRVIDLTAEHEELFCLCLEDWSDEAREAGPRRRQWVERCRPLGLRAKLALDDSGTVAGMIQYLPIERSFVDGNDLYMIHCVWVHGHKQGRGNLQGRGLGSALLAAAEQDARELGAKGLAAWGVLLPFWMRASWYRRHGFRKADRQGLAVLLWKPFAADAQPPRWFPRVRERPERLAGKVTVMAFNSGWCLAQNLVYERARRAAAELGERVALQEIDTTERSAVARWGRADAVLVDGKDVQRGPPPSYASIRKTIVRRLQRL